MVTTEVDGVTKYWNELSETWTPSTELPDEEIWEQFNENQQKAWLEIYNRFKKEHGVEII